MKPEKCCDNKIDYLEYKIDCCESGFVNTQLPIVGNGSKRSPIRFANGTVPGQIIYWNGKCWVPNSTIPPQVDDVLVWNGKRWIPQTGAPLKCWIENCGFDANGERYSQFIPKDPSNNVSAIFSAKGQGFIGANVPDNLAFGGGNRGNLAVDWQRARVDPTQVAGGAFSVIGGGQNNAISPGATHAVISGGVGNIVSGMAAYAEGDRTVSIGRASHSQGIRTQASGPGSFSTGWSTEDSILEALGSGAIASGYTEGNLSAIQSTASGSHAKGYTINSSVIRSSGRGAVSSGYADASSQITASADGSHASGWSSSIPGEFQGPSVVEALGSGSHVMGFARNSSRLASQSPGSQVWGAAVDNGRILASDFGSTASGVAFQNAEINCSSQGAHSSGFVSDSGMISTEAFGCHASGLAFNGNAVIRASQQGAHAHGFTASGRIISNGQGACVSGFTETGELIAEGRGSHSFGFAAGALGRIRTSADGSLASGYAVNGIITATAFGSNALGYVLENETSSATGLGNFALGRDVKNSNNYSLILGTHGTAKTSSNGNNFLGVPFLPPDQNRLISGTGSLQIAGGMDANEPDGISVIIGTDTWGSNPIGGGIADFWFVSGADYAEYFEWADGNTNNEDRCGYFVGIDESQAEKIIIAKETDDVIGIVSDTHGTSGYVGNAAEKRWHKALETDEFGRPKFKYVFDQSAEILDKYHVIINNKLREILQKDDVQLLKDNLKDVQVKDNPEAKIVNDVNKLNKLKNYERNISADEIIKIIKELDNMIPTKVGIPAVNYDNSKEYVPRSLRKEWIPVALLGQVYVRDNGECKPGKKCNCLNGIAVPGNKWRVLSRVSDHVIKILFQ